MNQYEDEGFWAPFLYLTVCTVTGVGVIWGLSALMTWWTGVPG